MTDELHDARRKKLQDNVRTAAMALFEHMGASAFRLQLGSGLYVIAGPLAEIHKLSEPEDNEP